MRLRLQRNPICLLALMAAATFASAQDALPAAALPQSVHPGADTSMFEVATIKAVPTDVKASRFITMQGTNRFVVRDYSLKLLIAAAYDLSPKVISGGPGWFESTHYDIDARTPGEARPGRNDQMAMLRGLLAERFHLQFHREQKEFSMYAMEVVKSGPKLKESAAPATEPSKLVSVVYPNRMVLPAHNATMAEFASLLQRAVLDRPVVDRTRLTGRYDFNLEWAPDESQFQGDIPAAPADASSPPFFVAVQQQLGLQLRATRGLVATFVIDRAEQPSAN